MFNLQNKVVLITGASAGIGAACAKRFAQKGAHLVLLARGFDRLQRLESELKQEHPALTVMCFALDVNDGLGFAQMLAKVQDSLGRIDILVNNAGLHKRGMFMDIEAADIAAMLQSNLLAPMLTSKATAAVMQKQSIDQESGLKGLLIQIASLAGRAPVDGAVSYSASKFGLRAFSYALDEELREAGHPVRSLLISPGPVDTGFIMADIDAVADITFSQKLCIADEVAKLVVQSAQDGKAERTTGGVLAPYTTHIAYLFPAVKRFLKPFFKRKGAKVKAALKQKKFS